MRKTKKSSKKKKKVKFQGVKGVSNTMHLKKKTKAKVVNINRNVIIRLHTETL